MRPFIRVLVTMSKRTYSNLSAADAISPKKQRKSPYKKQVPGETVINGQYELFYGNHCVFSQFHPCTFTVDNVKYNCMEQYMHHQKAVLFKDVKHATMIMKETDPLKQKKLGRQVEHFKPEKWGKHSTDIVKKGNLAKFGQHPTFRTKLLATHPRTLAEASPRDRLWGIGMGKNNPDAGDKSKWRGKNLLGYALTSVRDTLMKDISVSSDEQKTSDGEKKT